jgi:RHS repeat-associated protein
VLYEKNTNGTACYIYGPTGRLAKRTEIQGESHTYYYHTDHLGSTRLVTDESKNIVTNATYEPFGESTISGEESFLYTGKQKDTTSLYYYGARYYDPELGRFITRDFLSGEKINPQSLNRYTYCLNNPIKLIDPAGLTYTMCNVDTGVCIRVFEGGRDGWAAYDENGKITDNEEIETLIASDDPAKQAQYLMLLVTHPEIEGDPNQQPLDVYFDTGSKYTTWFSFKVTINDHPVIVHIGIDIRDYKLVNGVEYFGEMDEIILEDKAPIREFYIIFYQMAFSSVATLYHIAGHEGQHAVDYMGKNATSEKSAFAWNARHDCMPPFYIPFPFDRKKYRLPPCPGCP